MANSRRSITISLSLKYAKYLEKAATALQVPLESHCEKILRNYCFRQISKKGNKLTKKKKVKKTRAMLILEEYAKKRQLRRVARDHGLFKDIKDNDVDRLKKENIEYVFLWQIMKGKRPPSEKIISLFNAAIPESYWDQAGE
jgi:hypothetical protein